MQQDPTAPKVLASFYCDGARSHSSYSEERAEKCAISRRSKVISVITTNYAACMIDIRPGDEQHYAADEKY